MSRIITLDTMKNLSIDEIIKLYQLGYKLKDYRPEDNNIQNRLYSGISHSLSPDPAVDPVVNFGKATVSTGYDSFAMSIVLNAGDGLKFPNPSTDGAYNVVWWDSTDYPDPSDDLNKEIVRVTAKIGDMLTIERSQEGTTASDKNISGKTYNIILSLTAKTIIDIQNDYITKINTHSSTISGTHGVIGNVVGTSDIQSLTYKDITDMSNNVIAKLLKSATTAIDISTAPAPISGQVLTATSDTTATWQNLAAPSCFFVSILASPSSGTFPLPVNFNSTVIGGIAPYVYLWTFGDGTMSTNPAPNHTYTANGTFTSTLTVTDSIGNTATSATTITVLTGIGLVASGLGLSESIALPDFTIMYNAGPSVLDTYIFSDSLAGIYNASAGAGSPLFDTIVIGDYLAGIYNASVGSPILENIVPIESMTMISSISILSTITIGVGTSTTLIPTCYLYATPVICPILTWSSNNIPKVTVDSTGKITGIAVGTAQITAISGITSNICTVTVS